jgi:high-affinity K+ transport system ATPase subunit B
MRDMLGFPSPGPLDYAVLVSIIYDSLICPMLIPIN